MARASPIQVAFNSGEWSRTLDGRVDRDRYYAACRELVNFVPLIMGPAERRSGERYVLEAKTPAHRVTLGAFEFNAEQAYVLEFGENVLRFFTLGGLLLSSTTGLPVELVTPWTAEQARAIQYRQSADVMWLVHPDVPVQELRRTAADTFTLGPYSPTWEPFRRENEDETQTIQASATTGPVTLTATGFTFQPEDVNRLVKLRELIGAEAPEWAAGVDIHNVDTGTGSAVGDQVHWEGNVYRLANLNGRATSGTRPPIHTNEGGQESDGKWTWEYLHAGEGYARITSVAAGGATATAQVFKRLPNSCITAATFRWAWGAWDAVSGYPHAVEFFEERLVFSGTRGDPEFTWATRPGGSFDSFRADRTAEGALSWRMLSGKPNPIQTLGATKVLNTFTSGGIFPVVGSDPTAAISIDNLPARQRQIAYGVKEGVPALVVDNVALFVQRSGRAIREVLFDFDQDTFAAPDLSMLASHLLKSGVAGIAYAPDPYRMLLAWMEDGTLAGCLYDRPQEGLGWFQIPLGAGTGTAEVESVAVIPHPDGDVDQVWLAVKRTFGSVVVRSIGYLEKPFAENAAIEDAFFVDAGVSYDGAPQTVFGDLSHLEGQTVQIFADGARVADQVVAGGQVTLAAAASKVAIGLGYVSRVVPMRPEAGGEDGTTQGKTKRPTHLALRFFRTGEGTYYGSGASGAVLDELVLRNAFDVADSPLPLASGDTRPLPVPAGYDLDGLVAVEHRGPTPCTLVAMMPRVTSASR